MRPVALTVVACAASAAASTLVACERATPALRAAEVPAALRGTSTTLVRHDGAPTAVGRGLAHVYVLADPRTGDPVEVGVALDERALDGLPAARAMQHAPADGMEHADSHAFDLAMPNANGTPYRFVELDWNPGGHEPPGVYDVPHFDFHFYTVDAAVRNGIDPQRLGAQAFREKSGALPPDAERAPTFVALAPPGAPLMAVPRMGLHWIDPTTPELQAVFGKPEAFRPFTTTFIHGSWDGRFIFAEPMVTRAFILSRKTAAQRDSVITLPQPQRFAPAGFYPKAYRVTYDADAKEYHVALTQLVKR